VTDDLAHRFLTAWAQAHAAGDIDALVRLYTPTALFFGSTPDLVCDHAGIRRYFAALARHEDPSVAFLVLATHTVAPGVLETASIGTFRWSGNPGVRIRFTHALVERDGTWLATSHHASPG
jgi:ketosteroid isomerase-like protein